MTRPKKEGTSMLYEEEAVNSIAMIAPEEPNTKAKEEDKDYQERFRQYWGEVPKCLSKIPFGVGRYGDGKSLMEIFEVRVISIHRKSHKLNINGTITIDAFCGITDIFRRTCRNPEVIRSKDTLTLMGADIFTLADDYNYINLDIKDGRREICKGTVSWNYYNWRNKDNKILIGEVNGNYGMGFVTYSVFSRAMLITVELKLPKMEVFDFELSKQIDPIKIYGQIDFSITGVPTFDYVTTTLFRRKHTNGACMNAEGGLLPLSKSLIAFPLEGTVELSVHLKEHLPFNSGNSNVAIDFVRCTPKFFGHHKCKIDSKYGPIKVKLIAYPPYMHPNSLAAFKEKMRKWI